MSLGFMDSVLLPSTATIVSPGLRPAAWAGEPGTTDTMVGGTWRLSTTTPIPDTWPLSESFSAFTSPGVRKTLWPVSPSAWTMPRIAPQVRFWSATLDESTNLSWTSLSASQKTPMSDGAPGGVLGRAPIPEFAPATLPVGLTSDPPTPTPTTKMTSSVISRASTPPTRSGDRRTATGGAATQPVDPDVSGRGCGIGACGGNAAYG